MASLDAKSHLLEKIQPEIDIDYFGIPTFNLIDKDITFDSGKISAGDQFGFEPFVIRRDFHGLYDSTYDITQNFILYHNLYLDHEKKSYVDVLKDEEVVKYASATHVQIREDYLRDYLAAHKMLLVRYHYHKRSADVSVRDQFGQERIERPETSDRHNYQITIVQHDANSASSQLLGRDIILPYSKPLHEDYVSLCDDRQKYEKFTCKINEDGSPMEISCDQESKGHSGHFLTPTFFKKEVLQKYHNKPRFYTIKDNTISHLDLWGIDFDENDDGLIHVWLGDLGRIPHDEQLHWKSYNVTPRSGVNENFLRRQMFAEFTERDCPCDKLLELKNKTNANFESHFQFKLFRESSSVSDVEKNFHTLTDNEEKEFNEQILNMAKIFVDAIDKLGLEKKVAWKPDSGDKNKSLHFLEHFLTENLKISNQDAKTIVNSFRMVQKLRSESAAHLPGSDYNKTLKKFNLHNLDPKDRFVKVVNSLYAQMEFLNKVAS